MLRSDWLLPQRECLTTCVEMTKWKVLVAVGAGTVCQFPFFFADAKIKNLW